jgi:hypothetical protein
MVVIVKSSLIPGLGRVSIILYWWTAAHWQRQYPKNIFCRMDFSMQTVKATLYPEEDLYYCPAWLATNKKGHPKSTTCKKGILNQI